MSNDTRTYGMQTILLKKGIKAYLAQLEISTENSRKARKELSRVSNPISNL
jgi:hypothetical protein